MPNEEKQPKRRKKLNWTRFILLMIAIGLMAALGIGSGLIFAWATETPTFNPNDLDFHTTTRIYDINDNEIAKLYGGENRILVKIDEVPLKLKEAFLAIEDNKFYEHYGVDPYAIARAVWANITKGYGSQGASTITQQLIKLSFLTPEKSIKRKIQEALIAFQIERSYSKDEIFEFYLNRIYFGEGASGVRAAAQTYFGKEDLSQLTLDECALLAGLPNWPEKFNPYKNPDDALSRRNLVLSQMAKFKYISQEEADKAKTVPLVVRPREKSRTGTDTKYPFFIDHVIEQSILKFGLTESQLYKNGLNIYTTLDPKIQSSAEQALADAKNYPAGKDNVPIQAAIAIVEHSTGQVKALVGGRSHVTSRGLNRATDAKFSRQPGSAFKPIVVYGAALEAGLSPAAVVDDIPIKFGEWEPGNYDGLYRGLISMREAVRLSVNIYAVKMLNDIGINTGFNFAQKLGISTLHPQKDKNLSIALGGLTTGATPLEIASAYGAFGNRGVWIEPHVIRKVLDKDGQNYAEFKPRREVVMKESTAFLMTNILRTVVESGTGTNAQIPNRPVAGKTGTTELPDEPQFKGLTGNKDAWFAGYTPELSAAVWMGYDKTDRTHFMNRVYGGSFPAQIWRTVISKSLEGMPVKDFYRPPNIVDVAIDAKSGKLPSPLTPSEYVKSEIFDTANIPKEISSVWVEEEICADTGLPYVAGTPCSRTIKGVFLKRPVPYETDDPAKQPQDAELEIPKPLPGAIAEDRTEKVFICTDPRHNGKVLRARIPGPGEKGGCPANLVVEKVLKGKEVPMETCNLPDHKILHLDELGSPVEKPIGTGSSIPGNTIQR